MRIIAMSLAGLMAGMVPVRAGAEVIWQWTQEASGSGTANVFDGGPPVVADENSTTGPTDPSLAVSAIDRTQSGSLGRFSFCWLALRLPARGSADQRGVGKQTVR